MKKIFLMRNIIVATIVTTFLIWAFFQNQLFGKIMIVPFLICTLAVLGENISILLKKDKLTNIFHFIFRISVLAYIIGILGYTIYYAFAHESYSLLIIVVIFVLLGIMFFKNR